MQRADDVGDDRLRRVVDPAALPLRRVVLRQEGLVEAVTSAVSIPVIASGGAGALEHFYDALTGGGADAALAASLFHYRELSVGKVKRCQFKQRGPKQPSGSFLHF